MIKTGQENSLKQISQLLAPLFQEKDLQLLIVFGSTVHGTRHQESDIDLAFLFDHSIDILNLTNRVIRLLHTDQIDVVDLKRASPLLAFSVAQKGRVLYERSPGLFNSFFSLGFRRYVDTAKLRKAQSQSVQMFLEKGRQG